MKKFVLFGLLAIILVVSLMGTSVVLGKNDAAPQNALVTKAAFHDAMRQLWEDHVWYTREVIVDVFGMPGPTILPELSAATDELQSNQDDIGNAIKPFYGEAAGNQLAGLLHTHITIAGKILVDMKTNATANLTVDITDWYANAHNIAVFLNNANPKNWPLSTTDAMMKAHLDDTRVEILAEAQGRWADSIEAFDTVENQILMMADFLSNGIIAQFPQKFAKPTFQQLLQEFAALFGF